MSALATKRWQFAFFVVVSGIAAVANFFSRILFNIWTSYAVAIVLAFFVGLATAFLLNRRYVFPNSKNSAHTQAFWFVVVNLLALAETLAISLLLADLAFPQMGMHWHAREVAHAAGIAAPVFTSYLGHKYWTFR